MNNLSIFRKEVHTFLQRGQIIDPQHWSELMQHLCDLKLFNPKQIKLLNSNKQQRRYPITIPEFEQIIMRQFTDESSKGLLNDIELIKKQIRQAKGVLGIWRQKGLTKTQIKALEVTFAKGNNRMREICEQLQNKKNTIQSISQQQIQMINAMDEWVSMQNIQKQYQSYKQYQSINQKIIDELYSQIRVREVHFRKKPTKQNTDIMRLVGYNSKNDEPVQVYKIYKKSFQFQLINRQLITFNALKSLLLSQYFPKYLGYNITADPSNFLYFREYIQSKNLFTLLQNSTHKLQENMPIFKYWATQIYQALNHIFMISQYIPEIITLKDIEISQSGLKVMLKNLQFIRKRKQQQNIEPALLNNLGKLILELLGTNQLSLNDKIHNIQNKCLLNALIKAEEGHKRYRQKIVPCYVNFHNIQTHPLFQSNQEMHGLQVISNYEIIFS